MLRLRSGLGWSLNVNDYVPTGMSDTIREAAILANVGVLQKALGLPETGEVDAKLVAAVNKKLGTTHSATYIRENAILLADKIGTADKWPVWKLALVGGGTLLAVFVVVKLSKGR